MRPRPGLLIERSAPNAVCSVVEPASQMKLVLIRLCYQETRTRTEFSPLGTELSTLPPPSGTSVSFT